MLGSDSWNSRETEAYGNFLFTILFRAVFVPSHPPAGSVFLSQKHIDRSPPSNIEVELCYCARLQCFMVEKSVILT
jgi:hypothetical protein